MQRYYNAYSHALKTRFPWKVYKLPLDGEDILAPRWGRHKGEILERIEAEFARRGTCQGILFREEPQGDIGCDPAQAQRCIPPITAPIKS